MSSHGFIFLIIAIFQLIIIRAQDVSPDVRNDDEGTDFGFSSLVTSDDETLTDQICGTHPLKTIVKKIENSRKLRF